MSTKDDNRDSPQWHGGSLGDRFADAGHAERPTAMPMQGDRHPGGRSCGAQIAVAALVATALLVVPFLPTGSAARR